ncbi:protein of unknown function [Taphrina deformans PYCC 5710]|uniref:Uncharacterized protein n=1 Tax=Taphrina deformans (strain PYCC 5710 / ATCC 11124 / CBS 356.35 / IMI 108563 / JCM 9778 / NBRC 8474) TaxID=1097556 RepID=R4XBQ5_TAPDE|nr:protein of unknown function [Taphrina deformans PYCC 5710]|eukprot:CCG83223.1 protein of unknown function [Taphrina deformans PYCC 5710]
MSTKTSTTNVRSKTTTLTLQEFGQTSSWYSCQKQGERPHTAPPKCSVLRSGGTDVQETGGQWGPNTILPTRIWPLLQQTDSVTDAVKIMLERYQPILHQLSDDYSITPVRFGQTAVDSCIVMYIMVSSAETVNIIQQVKGPKPLPILVVKGNFRLSESQIIITAKSAKSGIGASLSGELYPERVGTMACFLQSASTKRMYALTCAHVSTGQSQVQCPTKVDLDYTFNLVQQAVQDYKERLTVAKQNDRSDRQAKLQDLKEASQKQLDSLLLINTNFGRTVFESWGFSTKSDAAITSYTDVGLIEVDPARVPPAADLNEVEVETLQSLQTIASYTEPCHGMRVFKRGRHGETTGFINAYPSTHAFNVTIGDTEFREIIQTWTILADGANRFSQPGDSGALIIEFGTNAAVGLLFGGGAESDGRVRDITYFLPFSVVLETCETAGYDLQFPEM